MAKMNPYLNFDGNAEEAFNFYKSVFKTEFVGGIFKMGDAPGFEHLADEEKNRVMHVGLPVNEHTMLMGSDISPSMGQRLTPGNSYYVSLHPSSKAEADELFNGLSAGGNIEMPMEETFWNAYFGCFKDKFGVQWMINYDKNGQ